MKYPIGCKVPKVPVNRKRKSAAKFAMKSSKKPRPSISSTNYVVGKDSFLESVVDDSSRRGITSMLYDSVPIVIDDSVIEVEDSVITINGSQLDSNAFNSEQCLIIDDPFLSSGSLFEENVPSLSVSHPLNKNISPDSLFLSSGSLFEENGPSRSVSHPLNENISPDTSLHSCLNDSLPLPAGHPLNENISPNTSLPLDTSPLSFNSNSPSFQATLTKK